MRIGVDISQVVYSGTGVGEYTKRLIVNLVKNDTENEYVLFFSSLRRKLPDSIAKIQNENVSIKRFYLPPTLLDILWNRLGIFPIEWFIGKVDVFISSDWTQPSSRLAKLVTVVHDLSPLKFPQEHHPLIVNVHKRRLDKVKKLCNIVICDSKATKQDLVEMLGISELGVKVVYPGGKL